MDLSQLWLAVQPFLPTLGPWGVVLGAAVPVLLRLLKLRVPVLNPTVPGPTVPGPGPVFPVPADPPRFPVLRALLDGLFKARGQLPPACPSHLPAADLDRLAGEVAEARRLKADGK